MGLPVFISPRITSVISDGDEIEIDFENNVVYNVTSDEVRPFEPLPDVMQKIFDAGGLLEYHNANPHGLEFE